MPGGVTGKGFKPGQSGNPGGRPKGQSVTAHLRKLLDQEHNGKTVGEILAEQLIKEAMRGKYPFAREVLDRTEGCPRQSADVNLSTAPLIREVESLVEAAESSRRVAERRAAPPPDPPAAKPARPAPAPPSNPPRPR